MASASIEAFETRRPQGEGARGPGELGGRRRHATGRVDDARRPDIRGARDGDARLDCADPEHLQVLADMRGVPVPDVFSDVHEKVRARGAPSHVIGEYAL